MLIIGYFNIYLQFVNFINLATSFTKFYLLSNIFYKPLNKSLYMTLSVQLKKDTKYKYSYLYNYNSNCGEACFHTCKCRDIMMLNTPISRTTTILTIITDIKTFLKLTEGLTTRLISFPHCLRSYFIIIVQKNFPNTNSVQVIKLLEEQIKI